MNWTIGERLAISGIIANWIMLSDNLAGSCELAQLIFFLSTRPSRFLEINISKFEAAIAEYRETGGDQ